MRRSGRLRVAGAFTALLLVPGTLAPAGLAMAADRMSGPVGVGVPGDAEDGPGQPRTSAEARAEAEAVRQEIAVLRVRVEQAVQRYADAVAALEGAATAETLAAQRFDLLAAAQHEAEAQAGATARALYMLGGSGSLYAAVLSGGSIADVLDGVTTVRALIAGTLLATDEADRIGSAAAAAADTQRRRTLTSTDRVRLVGEARLAAAEAQSLQQRLTQRLADAQAEAARLGRVEAAQAEAARQAELARQAEAARRAAEQAALAGASATWLPDDALAPMDLVSVLRGAGFAGEGLRTAWAIVMRESGGHPSARGAINRNGTRDHGLFQLNDVHLGRIIDPLDVYDAASNAAASFALSRGGTDWSHWGLGADGWAGHLLRDIPAVHADLQARYDYWYAQFPPAALT